jgi:hypothetical protein
MRSTSKSTNSTNSPGLPGNRGRCIRHRAARIGLSDDTRGCLLFRAALRGDIDAIALLGRIPRLRVRVASSEEMATLASGHVVTRELPK